ncbi:MAG: hypothetical protein ABR924_10230 [Terracidiphilus sp.]
MRDFAGLLARVRLGAEIVIENGAIRRRLCARRLRPAAPSKNVFRCCPQTLRQPWMKTSPAMLRRPSPLIVSR